MAGRLTVVSRTTAGYPPAPTPPPPPVTGFPTPSNTGYAAAPDYPGSLTTFTGSITDGAVIRFKEFVGGMYYTASNVTFYGCRFAATGEGETVCYPSTGSNDSIFSYCTFEPSSVSAPPAGHFEGYEYGIRQNTGSPPPAALGINVDRCNFWGFAAGMQWDISNVTHPLVVTNSCFHDPRDYASIDHTDGILMNVGDNSYVTITGNSFIGIGAANAIALQTAPLDHVTVTDNYLSGYGRTLNVGAFGPNTNVVVTDNTFGNDIQPFQNYLYGFTAGTGNLWRRNTFNNVVGGFSPFPATGKYAYPDDSMIEEGGVQVGHDTDYTG